MQRDFEGADGKVSNVDSKSVSHDAGSAKPGHLCSSRFHKTKQWQSHLFHQGGHQRAPSTHDFANQLLVRLCKRDREGVCVCVCVFFKANSRLEKLH